MEGFELDHKVSKAIDDIDKVINITAIHPLDDGNVESVLNNLDAEVIDALKNSDCSDLARYMGSLGFHESVVDMVLTKIREF